MKQMVAALLSAFAFLVFLCPCSSAEVTLLPAYHSYADPSAEMIASTANADTATDQYYTDSTSAGNYRAMLRENGFALCGSWTLPGGEDWSSVSVYAYICMGSVQPESFHMDVEGNSITCHLLLQEAALKDGRILLSMTRSSGIELSDPEESAPSPQPELPEILSGSCPYCNDGECRECSGSGTVRCEICNGALTCQTCHNKRRFYVSGYGVGQGTYVDCSACEGSGKCWRCQGTGLQDCRYCDDGVCPYCHGK